MKLKFVHLIAILASLTGSVEAYFSQCQPELRVGFFRPTEKKFRKIYQNWDALFQVEASTPVYQSQRLYGWGNVGYYYSRGLSLGLRDNTSITLLPLTIGIKRYWCFTPCLSAYLGIGGGGTYVRICDDNPDVVKHTNRMAWGGVLKSGINYQIGKSVFIDLCLDYSYMQLSVHGKSRNDADVGGLILGFGAGMFY